MLIRLIRCSPVEFVCPNPSRGSSVCCSRVSVRDITLGRSGSADLSFLLLVKSTSCRVPIGGGRVGENTGYSK